MHGEFSTIYFHWQSDVRKVKLSTDLNIANRINNSKRCDDYLFYLDDQLCTKERRVSLRFEEI